MNKKVEIIKKKYNPTCRYCCGKGWLAVTDGFYEECKKCKGTGKFDNSSYILIATKSNGEKIAFNVDQAGK